METQRRKETCPRSPSKWVPEPVWEPEVSGCLPRILNAQLRVMNTSVVSYFFCFEGMLASPVHVYSLDSAQFQDKAVLRRREAGLNDLLLGETQSVRDVCGRASWRVLRCWQGLMGFWDSQSTFQIRKRDLTEIFLWCSRVWYFKET